MNIPKNVFDHLFIVLQFNSILFYYLFFILVQVAWYVVWFPESKEYSVIPTNWIIKNDTNNDAIFCKWPPYKVTSDHLRNAINPVQSWGTFRIKFVGANKTYGKYLYLFFVYIRVHQKYPPISVM